VILLAPFDALHEMEGIIAGELLSVQRRWERKSVFAHCGTCKWSQMWAVLSKGGEAAMEPIILLRAQSLNNQTFFWLRVQALTTRIAIHNGLLGNHESMECLRRHLLVDCLALERCLRQ
jgi:hypothetical protein